MWLKKKGRYKGGERRRVRRRGRGGEREGCEELGQGREIKRRKREVEEGERKDGAVLRSGGTAGGKRGSKRIGGGSGRVEKKRARTKESGKYEKGGMSRDEGSERKGEEIRGGVKKGLQE